MGISNRRDWYSNNLLFNLDTILPSRGRVGCGNRCDSIWTPAESDAGQADCGRQGKIAEAHLSLAS
jgi:hypothetical protein